MSFRDHPCACGTAPLTHDCERICYWSAISAQAERGIRADQSARIEGAAQICTPGNGMQFVEAATGRSQFKAYHED